MPEHGAAARFNPMSVVKAAIKAVPAVKWALGVAGIAVALAIAATFFSDVTTALIGVAVMIPLMILLVVFARAADLKREFRTPALFLTWAVLLIFVGSAFLLFFSAFFDWPKPIHELLPFRGNTQKPVGEPSSGTGTGEQQAVTPAADARPAKSMRPSVPVPTPISPLNGAVFTHYPRATKLVWKGTDGPAAFLLEIQIQDPADGTWHLHPGLADRVVRGTSFSFNFIGGQPGRWRVSQIADSGERSSPSSWQYFSYDEPGNSPRVNHSATTTGTEDTGEHSSTPLAPPTVSGRLDLEEYCREEHSLRLSAANGREISCGSYSHDISSVCLRWFGSRDYSIESGTALSILCDTSHMTPPPCSMGRSLCRGNRSYCCPTPEAAEPAAGDR